VLRSERRLGTDQLACSRVHDAGPGLVHLWFLQVAPSLQRVSRCGHRFLSQMNVSCWIYRPWRHLRDCRRKHPHSLNRGACSRTAHRRNRWTPTKLTAKTANARTPVKGPTTENTTWRRPTAIGHGKSYHSIVAPTVLASPRGAAAVTKSEWDGGDVGWVIGNSLFWRTGPRRDPLCCGDHNIGRGVTKRAPIRRVGDRVASRQFPRCGLAGH
jgi:hypothetical protein